MSRHRSALLREEALKNIEIKKNILLSWIANGVPRNGLAPDGQPEAERNAEGREFFPKSLRQFKLWQTSDHSPALRSVLPAFHRTGNDTLGSRPQLRIEIAAIISTLGKKEAIRVPARQPGNGSRLASDLKQLLKIRFSENRELRRQLLQARHELKVARSELEGHIEQLRIDLASARSALNSRVVEGSLSSAKLSAKERHLRTKA